jgi:hypothetical protein
MPENRAVSGTWSGVVVAVSLTLLAACGAEDRPTFDELPLLTAPPIESPTAAPDETGSPTPSATASTSPTPSGEPADALADGRHPVYLTAVDAGSRNVTVDVVQFFTGTAATQAATEDRAPEIPPPNETWVRNRNTLLRTLSVAEFATVTVNTLAAEETGNSRRNLEIDLAKLAAYPSLAGRLFYVTVAGGTVTAIAEQYLP